jgi:predicted lipoprotein with Yx(FWY)xxD motif
MDRPASPTAIDGRRADVRVTRGNAHTSLVFEEATEMMRILVILMVMSLLLTGAEQIVRAGESPAPLKEAKAGDLGTILTDPAGMTLYTFANDTEPGKSTCIGPCADNWPDFRPPANAPVPKPPLSIITRDDGTQQYAYRGKPLYHYSKDQKAGDTMGHKFRDRWFVAQP